MPAHLLFPCAFLPDFFAHFFCNKLHTFENSNVSQFHPQKSFKFSFRPEPSKGNLCCVFFGRVSRGSKFPLPDGAAFVDGQSGKAGHRGLTRHRLFCPPDPAPKTSTTWTGSTSSPGRTFLPAPESCVDTVWTAASGMLCALGCSACRHIERGGGDGLPHISAALFGLLCSCMAALCTGQEQSSPIYVRQAISHDAT